MEKSNRSTKEKAESSETAIGHLASSRENELKLQLAMADQETNSLQRKLDEFRTENEKLMEAVKYLRFKLETAKSGKSEDEKETALQYSKDQGGKGDAAFQSKNSKTHSSMNNSSQSSETGVENREKLVEKLEGRIQSLEDECRKLRGSGSSAVDDGNAPDSGERNKCEMESQSTKFWKNRVLDLENEISEFSQEFNYCMVAI